MQNWATLLLWALGLYLVYLPIRIVTGLLRNIYEVKKTGLPWVLAPFSPFSLVFKFSSPIWAPLVKRLPRAWWENWIDIMLDNWAIKSHHHPFAKHGETFALVSPFQILIITDSAEVIHQVSQQRDKFHKLLEIYDILRQYGDNLLSTEGAAWRRHRKATSPAFTEKNVALIFQEAVAQSQSMIRYWTVNEDGTPRTGTIESVDRDTCRFALGVIGFVGFGLRILWPGQASPQHADPKWHKFESLEVPEGYTTSFSECLVGNMSNIMWLMLAPPWVLRRLPFECTKRAADAREDFDKYIDEMIRNKTEDVIKFNNGDPGMDLLGHLVRTKYAREEPTKVTSSGTEKQSGGAASGQLRLAPEPLLSDSEIIGNAFIMFIAGHETTANATHFTAVHLAARPASQRAVQRDIDNIFDRDSNPASWKYEDCINPMSASMIGASLNETLRLIPAAGELPKRVNPERDGIVTINGQRHALPGNAHILVVSLAAHRNPNLWPTQPSRITDKENDLDDYIPERWFRTGDGSVQSGGTEGQQANIAEDNDSFRFTDTSEKMFRPAPGAYTPFGDGPRSCIGRRIAQAEVMVAISVLFQKYSVELAVDEWATDEEVERMDRAARRILYAKAQARFRELMTTLASLITVKLPPGSHVPVRLVPRGQERFVNFVDDGT
ncbi:hypothetical protein VD0004_g6757 [Verticillium dahliae]|nr:hypothetical protein VD0004_g6757 [Verticillium dahliae]PNH66156.1 hypothetical protein VD0001_g8251 [Verticillium dahliae]